MITQVTAQRIADVFVEIEDCKSAIDLMETELKSEGEPHAFINVSTNKNDDGVTITLTPEIAMEAIEKQAGILEAEQVSLNQRAVEETMR